MSTITSWENLTDEIEKRARDYIDKIDQIGGSVPAVEKGYIQQEIQESAYRYQKDVEAQERIVVGVNKFTVKEEAPKNLLKVSQAVQDAQMKRLAESLRGQEAEQLILGPVEILVFVHEHMPEQSLAGRAQGVVATQKIHAMGQQIVEIHGLLPHEARLRGLRATPARRRHRHV